MISQVFNNTCNTYYNFGCKTADFAKSIANKIGEIANKIFSAIAQFAVGFCLGAAATSCYILFQPPHLAHSADLKALSLYALLGGMFIGIGKAVSSWRGEPPVDQQITQ